MCCEGEQSKNRARKLLLSGNTFSGGKGIELQSYAVKSRGAVAVMVVVVAGYLM
jgi:hypothetical protein